jgi:SAM-dependent methyltransferase
MYRDITEIKQFYQSPLGRATSGALRQKIKKFWPDLDEGRDTVAGIGYAIPFLNGAAEAKHFSVMAASLGAGRWPHRAPSRTVVTEDYILPFPEQSLEKLLLVHAVENADYLRELMHEAWRVLKPNGRILMVVPSRSGLWSRADKTPFGHGRPYSMKQMRNFLREAQFTIENHTRALYFFPSHNRLFLAVSHILDVLGEAILPKFGGVILVEASKQLYNMTPLRVRPSEERESWKAAPVPAGFSQITMVKKG